MHGREPRSFAAGEVIFSEGDEADGLYIVGRGSVELRDGERVVDTIAAPGLFGEMALVEDQPRSLTAVAVADAELYVIPPRQFWVLVSETPNFARLVMSVMSQRVRHTGSTT